MSNSSMAFVIKNDSQKFLAKEFYLRGYEAINKEIELIENRKIIEPFISELREIEKRIRGIQQDKSLDRVKSIYQKTLAKQLDTQNISVTFITQGYQQNPDFTKNIYRKEFSTPSDLEPIFAGWFQTLKMQI